MPINASPHYLKAESDYLQAQTKDQKIQCLKKMIALAPKHKGSENLLAQLKKRLAKLKYTKEKEDKGGKSSYSGIKKHEMQAIIVGKTNSGKSTLLNLLTNQNTLVSPIPHTTLKPQIGMLHIHNTQIQIIENPSIDGDFFDRGIIHTTDTIIILINNLNEITDLEKNLPPNNAQKMILLNLSINPSEKETRKFNSILKSKKVPFYILTPNPDENQILELKELIFSTFKVLRIFTKEPGKEKSPRPVILKPDSTIKDIAEKILKGFSKNIKQTKIWGPSSKFPGQIVGLDHKLKDLDTVEFKTN